jgi:hypothetical protein
MASAPLRSGEGGRLAVLSCMLAAGWSGTATLSQLPRSCVFPVRVLCCTLGVRSAGDAPALQRTAAPAHSSGCCALQVRHQRHQPQAPP